jgi:glycosyltransferase involved in cell wall biosynthesis
MPDKLVSICIPAYENVVLLKRLLDSVALQNYPAIEVIISDDSAGEDIKNAISDYEGILQIKYFKNFPPLRSPGNWNNALDKASGDLLMLMHQDDWLNGEDVIRKYVDAFNRDIYIDFVFSRSMAFTDNDSAGLNSFHKKILHKIENYPEWLLLGNVIGPPSNVMVQRSVDIRYAPPLIWLVDVDYYMRLLMEKHNFYFIDEPLVSIGLHEEQATKYVEQNREIILREHLMLAARYGEKIFSEWRIYDLYWRLLRNFKIKEMGELALPGIKTESLPASIKQILKRQRNIPPSLLNTGIVSKMLMWLGYRNK